MATKDMVSSINQKGAGDAAVDGLLAGVLAGIIMGLFLIIAGFITGESLILVLQRFDIQAASRPTVGLITHIAISAIYGLIFGVLFMVISRLWSVLLRWSWYVGLVYGLLLFGVAQVAFSAGANASLAQFAPFTLLLAHLMYGVVLVMVIRRKWGLK